MPLRKKIYIKVGSAYYDTKRLPTDISLAELVSGNFIRNVKTDSHTLELDDAEELIEMDKATANTLTVPPYADAKIPVGTSIMVVQKGAGQTSIAAGAGVTIRSSGSKLKLSGQYSGATLTKVGTNEWYLFGDITS
jgi:hypothetical protein